MEHRRAHGGHVRPNAIIPCYLALPAFILICGSCMQVGKAKPRARLHQAQGQTARLLTASGAPFFQVRRGGLCKCEAAAVARETSAASRLSTCYFERECRMPRLADASTFSVMRFTAASLTSSRRPLCTGNLSSTSRKGWGLGTSWPTKISVRGPPPSPPDPAVIGAKKST